MEERIARSVGMQFEAISAGKFRRNHEASALGKVANLSTLGLNARDVLRTAHGVAGAMSVLRHFRPDVIFLKGGYVCLPIGIAAYLLRIPFVIHESDVSPGLTNRILGRWATKIAVGFPEKSYHDFDTKRLVYTGNPVRRDLLKAHRLEGLAALKLDSNLPIVLVTGGSQGAAAINDCVMAALPELLAFCQVVHLTGERELERVKFELGRSEPPRYFERYRPFAFLMAEMGPALAAADVVVARAGANSIAELAALGKPTILIPNYQMAGHQEENAKLLSRAGAMRVLDERKLTPQRLIGELKRLVNDEGEQHSLVSALKPFVRPDADMELARVILDTALEHHPVLPPQNAEDAEEEQA